MRELIGPYLGNASDEAAKALPSFGKPATAIILYRREGAQRPAAMW